MIEPVAYVQIRDGKAYSVLRKGTPNNEYTPVYRAEQLHPRMKMTHSEFDEWKCLYENTIELSLTAYRVLNEILNSTHNSSGKYIELSKRVYQENDSMTISKKQAELTDLFINYSPDNPSETIEIVPNTKWFVRSKEPEDEDEYYLFLSGSNLDDLDYFGFDYARSFDTKEEAEKWTNPLTEAVQLPVEEK